MGKHSVKHQANIEITAYWGNDDAVSSIGMSPRQWKEIQDGGEYVTSGWGWYEGSRFSVTWAFARGVVSIDGEDGIQCVVELPVAELLIRPGAAQEGGQR